MQGVNGDLAMDWCCNYVACTARDAIALMPDSQGFFQPGMYRIVFRPAAYTKRAGVIGSRFVPFASHQQTHVISPMLLRAY